MARAPCAAADLRATLALGRLLRHQPGAGDLDLDVRLRLARSSEIGLALRDIAQLELRQSASVERPCRVRPQRETALEVRQRQVVPAEPQLDPAAAVEVGRVPLLGVDRFVAVLESPLELDAQQRPRSATFVQRGVATDFVRMGGEPLVQLAEGLRRLLEREVQA